MTKKRFMSLPWMALMKAEEVVLKIGTQYRPLIVKEIPAKNYLQ